MLFIVMAAFSFHKQHFLTPTSGSDVRGGGGGREMVLLQMLSQILDVLATLNILPLLRSTFDKWLVYSCRVLDINFSF